MTRIETWLGVRPFEIAGHAFTLLSTINPVNVKAYDSQGHMIENEQSVESGFFIDRRGLSAFARVEIETSALEAVKFLYSDGTTGSSRAVVDIVDGGKARTLKLQAFAGRIGVAAVAAQNGHVQLLNPVGSLKRAVVKAITLMSDQAGQIHLFEFDTALTTLVASAANKLIGGALSTCEQRQQTNAGLLAGVGSNFGTVVLQANVTSSPIVFNEPLVLTAGKGFFAQHVTVNALIIMNVDFYEETV